MFLMTAANLFFLSILFPYLSFGLDIPSDSQPWAFFLGTLIVLLYHARKAFDKKILFLLFICTFCVLNLGVFLIFGGGDTLLFWRAAYKYFGIAIIVPATAVTIPLCSVKVFEFSLFTWFLVSALQVAYKRPFVTFLLPRASIVFSRNFAIGLAPEPAYLAKMAIFFLVLVDLFAVIHSIRSFKVLILKAICFFMVIVSLSLTGLVLLSSYVMFRMVLLLLGKTNVVRKMLSTVVVLFLLLVLIVIARGYLPAVLVRGELPGKAGRVLQGIAETGFAAIYSDRSFYSRYSTFVHAATSVFKGYLFGIGVPKHPIGSIFSPVEENGIYGLILVTVLLQFFLDAIRLSKGYYRILSIELALFFIMMGFSESLATSYFPFLVGLAVYVTRIKKETVLQ